MKNTNKMLRLAALLLCLLMAVSVFAACKNEEETPVNTNGGPVSTGRTDTDERGKIKDKVPQLNYNMTFTLLAAQNQKSHFYAEETDLDNVKQAIYDRNLTVEDRLGVEIDWRWKPCYATADKQAFSTEIENDAKTNSGMDAAIDGSVSYNLVPYHIASKGILQNLNATKYIDLTSPWWPQEYLENMLYKNSVYALVDNASVGTLTNLSCIFFNNTMLEAKKIESPYDLVPKNEWTIGKLRELCKDTYEDTDLDGKKSTGDTFGIATSTYARVTCWYYGAGIRMSEIDKDGNMVLTGGEIEKIDSALKEISTLFDNDNGIINDSTQYKMFDEARAYFYLCVLTQTTHMVKDGIEIDYGVAPNPKLNSEQTRYYTHVPNTHDAWAVPKHATNVDCSSALVELMASESYRQVNDVFFEQNLKIRYAPDEKLAIMYDLIRESIVFDYVYIHKESSIGADCDNALRNCIKTPTSYNWQGEWDRFGESLGTKFQALMDAYDVVAG